MPEAKPPDPTPTLMCLPHPPNARTNPRREAPEGNGGGSLRESRPDNGSNTPNEPLELNTREILLYSFLILIFHLSLEIDFYKINSIRYNTICVNYTNPALYSATLKCLTCKFL